MGFDAFFFCVNMALLGFRRGFPKIHDSVEMVRAANEMNPCGVKILPLTDSLSLSRGSIFLFFTIHNQPHEELR